MVPIMALADYVLPGLEDLEGMYGESLTVQEAMDRIRGIGCPLTVLKLAEKGAAIVSSKGFEVVPSVPVAVPVDVMGVGDAFAAGVVAGPARLRRGYRQVKNLDRVIAEMTQDDEALQLIMTIPSAGLVPWVQNSNETIHHGRITKRGPVELRTALVQVVLGMVRMRRRTGTYRIIERYDRLKRAKGSGRSIIACGSYGS